VRIEGEGLPNYQQSGSGDLYIEYHVVFPSSISPSLRTSTWSLGSLSTNESDRGNVIFTELEGVFSIPSRSHTEL
jgi:DnaJ-class molecular chaperone